jgi:hypothetical protein
VKPPVRVILGLVSVVGGIKVRLGKVNLILCKCTFFLLICHFPELKEYKIE